MMLTWENGHCTNPPPARTGSPDGSRWEIAVTLGPGWSWLAGLVHDDAEFGVWCPRSYHEEGYATERQAQLACESALLRLGLLPLPDLESGEALRGYTAPIQERFADGSPAPVRFWGWRVARVGNYTVAAGECESEDAASAAAERHLRAELAAWLDVQAAEEGV